MTENLIVYKRLPIWTAATLPDMVKEKHNTKVGTWGKLTILQGQLKFFDLDEAGQVLEEHIFSPETETPFVEPQAWHKVEALSPDLECYLEFYCRPRDYFSKKYNLTAVHSEVLEASETVPVGKALDLGCGQGRNALFLNQLGFEVTAVDRNPLSLEILASIIDQEDLDLELASYDINQASLIGDYDFILSTVVFMFLDSERVPAIIADMQDHTKLGGYNLIVCAMDTASHPCTMPFSFTFKEGELKEYYKDWELIKYNENLGKLHKRDENGRRIELQFATMLAKKIKS
ncbi:SAM-dependent methyltransferase TehB [Streptococcus oricebi]|uniref:Tellurite resistance methyltransferase TehB n=1 Tax=Streptococcus oricebi TaxID=1547447 RepID=A0ABS5B316_9STRE|nr:SAM-dependent methyltransferase TehB [Streptococcus oricebi]MBP2622901.1 tellurite resistance methyltransferase TehB [Streptococcus oricebi]